MSKDKKRTIDIEEKKTTMFYYEIIGVVIILFSMTILGKMGRVGEVLTTVFKVCFGDWYWLFVIILLFVGFYYLFLHKSFSFKNQKFIAVVFIYIALILFAHFPIHNYISDGESSYLAKTWSIYRAFISGKNVTTLGGGMVGALLFYLFYLLFGKFGVIFCGILILLLSFSLLINRSLLDIIKFIFDKLKNIKKYTGSFNNFFRYELGKKKEPPKKNPFAISQKLSLKSLPNVDNQFVKKKQERVVEEQKHLINASLRNLNIEFKEYDIVISYSIVTYRFLIYQSFSIEKVLEKIEKVLDSNILYSYLNNIFSLQVEIGEKQILTIKSLLLAQENFSNNYLLPLGIDYQNELVEVDITRSMSSNILIFGEKEETVQLVNSILLALFVKNDLSTFDIIINDPLHYFEVYDNILPIEYSDIFDFIEVLKEQIDERLKGLNIYQAFTFEEYLYKLQAGEINPPTVYKRQIIIINALDCHFAKDQYHFLENKLMYIAQMCCKVGIATFFVTNASALANSIICSIYNNRIVYKTNDSTTSEGLLGNINGEFLIKGSDAIFAFDNKTRRIETPLTSNATFVSAIKNLK